MTYDELCTALARDFGRCSVYISDRPDLTTETGQTAGHIIWHAGTEYRVGGLERNEFRTGATFETEDDACQYVYDNVSRSVSARRMTEAENEQAKVSAAKAKAEFSERFPDTRWPSEGD